MQPSLLFVGLTSWLAKLGQVLDTCHILNPNSAAAALLLSPLPDCYYFQLQQPPHRQLQQHLRPSQLPQHHLHHPRLPSRRPQPHPLHHHQQPPQHQHQNQQPHLPLSPLQLPSQVGCGWQIPNTLKHPHNPEQPCKGLTAAVVMDVAVIDTSEQCNFDSGVTLSNAGASRVLQAWSLHTL